MQAVALGIANVMHGVVLYTFSAVQYTMKMTIKLYKFYINL